MEYMKVLICFAAMVYALYVAFINAAQRFSHIVNRLFSFIAFLTACMVGCLLAPMFITDIDGTTLARWYFGLIIIINQCFFHYTQIFPRWEKKSSLLSIILSAIPGVIAFLLSIATDSIISSGSFAHNHIEFVYGQLIVLYIGVFGFYIAGTFFILLYKVRRLENISFRYQLFYLFMGNHIGALVILSTFIVMPYVFQRYDFHGIGISSAALFLLYINNYALSDERYLDFKGFYLSIILYCVLFALTIIPTYYILVNSYRFFLAGGQIPAIAVAFLNFAYLVLFTRLIQPYVEKFFRREYAHIENRFNNFVQVLAQAEEFEGEPAYWDRFFSATIDSFEYLFQSSYITVLMYNDNERAYILSHHIGDVPVKRIAGDHSLAVLCQILKTTIHQSLFYTDEVVKPFDDVREMVIQNKTEVILPCFDSTHKLFALLIVGYHKKGRPYTYQEIQFMELFRVKFSNALVNSLQIEMVKAQQVGEHDNVVVGSIKNSIIPRQMPYIDHIRFSSFFMNNSNLGGEFYKAKVLNKNTVAFFIADYSYSGIDAGVMALELYSAFDALSPAYDTPEKIMQMVNWVVCTSNFSDRYATALCLTFNSKDFILKYINGAFNPLIIYEIKADIFLDLDTKGIPIGIERDFIYESKEYSIKGPCIGCVYSNGITGAVNQSGQPYSIGRIKDLMRLHSNESPALLVRRISADINTYISNTTVREDISVVMFRIE